MDNSLNQTRPFTQPNWSFSTSTKATVHWIRANAEKHGLAPNSIGVWGASAGAHLGNLLGTVEDPLSKVQAVRSKLKN